MTVDAKQCPDCKGGYTMVPVTGAPDWWKCVMCHYVGKFTFTGWKRGKLIVVPTEDE